MSQEFVFYCVISSYLYFTEPEMLEAEGSDMFFKRDEISCSCSKWALSRCDGRIHKTSTNPRSHKPWAECQPFVQVGSLFSIWYFSEEVRGWYVAFKEAALLLFTTVVGRTELCSWAWVRPVVRTTGDSQPRLWASQSWKWILLLETDHHWGQNLWSQRYGS